VGYPEIFNFMKDRKDIISQILFHETQYRLLSKITGKGEPLRSLHLGQAIALRWVIGERTTPVKALKAELSDSEMSISAANARLNVYEEVIGHIELTLPDYETEQDFEALEQAKKLIQKLTVDAEIFKRRYFG